MPMIHLSELLDNDKALKHCVIYGKDYEFLPDDAKYVIFEMYCDNPACRCLSLRAKVMQIKTEGNYIEPPAAIIHYEWTTKRSSCRPTLAEDSPNTHIARQLLTVYKKIVRIPDYIKRVKNQYKQVKEKAAEQGREKNILEQTELVMNKIGRNELCPCGSGKKYKRCCST